MTREAARVVDVLAALLTGAVLAPGRLEHAAVGDPALQQPADEVVVQAGRLGLRQRLLVGLARLAGLDGAALLEPVVAGQDERADVSASRIGGISRSHPLA